MSGTSLDGVDTALVDLSQSAPRLVSSYFQPYPQRLKNDLLALHVPSHDELHRSQLIANQLAREYAKATRALLRKAGVDSSQVQAIGCHGQTVRHRPEHGYSVQLNNAALLAELTGIHVVSDFRSRDIAAGGQGAPLVPAFHDHVLRHPTLHRAILNIGGIANLTNLKPGVETSGFDCGPGNLLMDGWIFKHQGSSYDKDGQWAESGSPIHELIQKLMADPFFCAAPPLCPIPPGQAFPYGRRNRECRSPTTIWVPAPIYITPGHYYEFATIFWLFFPRRWRWCWCGRWRWRWRWCCRRGTGSQHHSSYH